MIYSLLFAALLWYVPLFLAPGRASFKSSGVPAHGDPTTSSCCCHTEAPLPCGNCNAGSSPRVLQATIGPGSLANHTCLDCATKFQGLYVLTQTLDSACNYAYCEPDECQDFSPGGDPCKVKFFALLSNNGAVEFSMGFCDTSPNCGTTAAPSAIRFATWNRGSVLPDFTWDCLSLDDDLDPVLPPDGNIDYAFCQQAGTVHIKALP